MPSAPQEKNHPAWSVDAEQEAFRKVPAANTKRAQELLPEVIDVFSTLEHGLADSYNGSCSDLTAALPKRPSPFDIQC